MTNMYEIDDAIISTYRFERIFVNTDFHVEILQVIVWSFLSWGSSRLLVYASPPRSIHLLILLLCLRILVVVVWRPLLLLGLSILLGVCLDRS